MRHAQNRETEPCQQLGSEAVSVEKSPCLIPLDKVIIPASFQTRTQTSRQLDGSNQFGCLIRPKWDRAGKQHGACHKEPNREQNEIV